MRPEVRNDDNKTQNGSEIKDVMGKKKQKSANQSGPAGV